MARPRKLWRYSHGLRPDTAQVVEKRLGAPLYLRWTDASGREQGESLGFRLRDTEGRIDPDREAQAKEAAQEKSLALQYARLKGATEPSRLTVGLAVDLFLDTKRGGLPNGKTTRAHYRRALKRFRAFVDPSRPWARVVPADVRALVRKIRDEHGPTEARATVQAIRRLYHWLDGDAGYEGIRDPTKGIKLKKDTVGEDYRPHKPRFTPEEARRMIETRHDPLLDRRWALFLALMDDSGRRGVQIRRLFRSHVDYLPPDVKRPGKEDAPYGWVWYVGTKGQRGVPHALTEFERRELDLALSTWLAPLEDRWQTEGRDFPLVPGETFPKNGAYTPGRVGADRPISYEMTKRWLRRAEEAAEVPHVRGRGLHGIRRTWVAITRPALGIEGAQYEGGWSNRETVEGYDEEVKWDVRRAARELHEQKRTPRKEES